MPSSRRELTCSPALPGGRFPIFALAACSRPTIDSKGSRLATLGSGAGPALAEVAGLLLFGAVFLAAAGFGEDLGLVCGAAGLAACVEDFAVAGVAGAPGFLVAAGGCLAVVGAGLFCAAGAEAAGFAVAGLSAGLAGCWTDLAAAAAWSRTAVAGFACACRAESATTSVIPSMRVFAKRIFRSFPFRVSPPASPL